MKNLGLLALAAATLMAITPCALATNKGPYLGLGAGVGTFKSPNQNVFTVSGPDSSTTHTRGGLSGRAFTGYNFNPYFGLELGYARYARSLYRGISNSNYSSVTYYGRSIDLVAKGYLPFGYTGFNVYALAGAARVNATVNYPNTDVPLNSELAAPPVGTTHTYKTRPIYGAGVSYDFTPCFSGNVEFTQIRHLGNLQTNPLAIPDMDLATINISYFFG